MDWKVACSRSPENMRRRQKHKKKEFWIFFSDLGRKRKVEKEPVELKEV